MPFLNSVISWLNIKRINQISLYDKYPLEIQTETLLKLIDKAKYTEWGKMYDYETIKSYSDFKERVPLQDYDKMKSYIVRLRQGQKNLLWPGEIKWFAKSSGTTSDKSKFIPVTSDSLEDCHFRCGRDVLALYNHNYPENGIFSGKSLTLGGSHQINNFNNDSYYGDLSAILIENIPFWVNFIRTPKAETVLIEDFEKKIESMVRETVTENVTSIAGVPSWNLVLLKRVLEYTGKSNLLEVWPNLELFIHGGISFVPYREQFNTLVPSEKMHYMETYNASEGFFAIQNVPGASDMLLMLDVGVFYEFIPLDKVNDENPETLTLEQVETGPNYAMVISTNGGLWRYMIGDTVQFTSKYPFKIKISGRTRHFINAFGEEVIVDNAIKALDLACSRTGAVVLNYTAGPVFMTQNEKGAHEWLIEFEKMPDSLEHFAELLDNTLKSVNSDYEAKRFKNAVLTFPKVSEMPKGVFYQWLKEKNKLGGQYKVPPLSNDRKYIEELLQIYNRMK